MLGDRRGDRRVKTDWGGETIEQAVYFTFGAQPTLEVRLGTWPLDHWGYADLPI